MSLFFISDLHLSPARESTTEAFYDFLDNTAKGAESLYILGDFFDIWLGDDDDTPIYQDIIKKLKHYSETGPRLYFMRGNRDFLIGGDFARRSGATLLKDPTIITYRQQSLLLMHGDSLCTLDEDYIAFRNMTRSAKWKHEFLSKPLAQRIEYANQVRQQSKTMSSMKADDIMDVTPKEVEKLMSNYSTPLFIHGHTHRPDVHLLTINDKAAKRVVLGDWHDSGWYARLDNQEITLTSFDI